MTGTARKGKLEQGSGKGFAARLLAAGLSAALVWNGVPLSVWADGTGAQTEAEEMSGTGEASGAGVSKEETVYIFTDASGAQKSMLVSDWLKTNGMLGLIADTSSLTDIQNVKGEESYTQDGASLTWNADGKDIYYQGVSSNEAPVDVHISYWLDGEQTEPSALGGASGHLKIRYDYVNREQTTVEVDGEQETVYVPFGVLSGCLFTEGVASNVTVSSGKVLVEGGNTVVVGLAFPGLSDSLDLEDDSALLQVELPDYVEIEADVVNFSMDMNMTLVLDDVLDEVLSTFDEKQDESGLEDLQADLSDLETASSELVEGSSDLYEGMSELDGGVSDLDEGAQALSEGAADLKDGIDTYTEGVGTAAQGAGDLLDGARQVAVGAGKLAGGATELKEGTTTLREGAERLDEGVGTLSSGAGSLDAGAKTLAEGTKTLDESTSALTSGTSRLHKGTKKVKKGADQLAQGAGALNTGVDPLVSGIGTAVEGIKSSVSSMQTLSESLDPMAQGAKQIKQLLTKETIDGLSGQLSNLIRSMGALKGYLYQNTPSETDPTHTSIKNLAEGANAILSGVEANQGTIQAQLMQALMPQASGMESAAEEERSAAAAGADQSMSAAEPNQSAAGADQSAAENLLAQAQSEAQAAESSAASAQSSRATAESEGASASAQYESAYGQYAPDVANLTASMSQFGFGNEIGSINTIVNQAQSVAGTYNQGLADYKQASEGYESAIAGYQSAIASYEETIAQYRKLLEEQGIQSGPVQGAQEAAPAAQEAVSAAQETAPSVSETAREEEQNQAAGLNDAFVIVPKDYYEQLKTCIGGISTIDSTLESTLEASFGEAQIAQLQGLGQSLTALYNGLNTHTETVNGASSQVPGLLDGVIQMDAAVKASMAGSDEKVAAANALVTGAQTLKESLNALSGGALTLSKNIPALVSGAKELKKGAKKLAAAIHQVADGSGTLSAGASALNTGMGTLAQGTADLAEGARTLESGAGELSGGTTDLKEGSIALDNGVYKLKDGLDTLDENSEKLTGGSADLAEGAGKLADGTGELKEGSNQLLEGAQQLSEGMQQFNDEGIEKIAEAFDGDLTTLMNRIRALRSAGEGYNSFSGIADGMDGSVKFIIRSDSIQAGE